MNFKLLKLDQLEESIEVRTTRFNPLGRKQESKLFFFIPSGRKQESKQENKFFFFNPLGRNKKTNSSFLIL